MRVLAIDPALRKTGYAVLERVDIRSYRAVCYGVIHNKPTVLQSRCLVAIRDQLTEVILKALPDVCAIESTIYVQSYRTAIILGAARGAALLAAAEGGLAIFEYAPRRVKQAVVGKGAADKSQVAYMMRALLNLTETPQPDAADALAIGMAHLYAHDPQRTLKQSASQI